MIHLFPCNIPAIITSPSQGLYTAIKNGIPFAVDNEAYTGKFELSRWESFLHRCHPYRNNCLFVTVPDFVGDAEKTLAWFELYQYIPSDLGFPVAFVAQDGLEEDPDLWPDDDLFDVVFIGGSTEWKMGEGARDCIYMAVDMDKRVHIGRINSWKRYEHFRGMAGSDKWTCDGTSVAFDRDKTIHKWLGDPDRPYQRRLL